MRIRKHAKISPLLYTCSSLNPAAVTQTHVCQLNQSPWDVMTFPPQDPATLPPPPPFLADKELYRSYLANRIFANHVTAEESPRKEKWDDILAALEVVDTDKEEEDDRPRIKEEEEDDDDKPRIKEEEEEEEEEEVILCSKTDKKGWQCGERVKKGHPFCEYHLSKRKKSHISNSKKPDENRRRARPKKPASSSSNPYEFYYYSGFGPRWGKRRGTTGNDSSTATGTVVRVKEQPYSSPENSSGSDTYSSATKNVGGIIEVADDDEGYNGNSNSANTQFDKVSEIDNEGCLDYVDDEEEDYEDYDEEHDDDNEIGKKRARKPIKARSLKSLM